MITRDKLEFDAMVKGQPVKLAASLKDGNRLIFWYWFQDSSGEWREFDLRTVCPSVSESNNSDWLDRCVGWNLREQLTAVAALIADVDLSATAAA